MPIVLSRKPGSSGGGGGGGGGTPGGSNGQVQYNNAGAFGGIGWWTVDSTPGAEKVTFAGDVRIEPATDNDDPLIVKDHNGEALLSVFLTGSGETVRVDGRDPDALVFEVGAAGAQAEDIIHVSGDGGDLLKVGPTGAVTVSPGDSAATPLTLHSASDAAGGETVLWLENADSEDVFSVAADGTATLKQRGGSSAGFKIRAPDNAQVFIVDPTGAVTINPGGSTTLQVDEDEIGFFGATPVAQPAAPTTINEVVAALQTLGLVDT